MDPIATTALGAARIRAIESARPDRIFEDPLAAHFVAAEPRLPPVPANAAPEMVALARYLVIRTRFFDEMLLDAANTCRQIVVLGAGLDARAFRFAWPENTRLFEVDKPEMLSWKQQVLDGVGVEPKCDRIIVPTDLRTDWSNELTTSGHDPTEPTAWLAEGLLVYLTTSVIERLLNKIALRSPVGSRLGLTTTRGGASAPTSALKELWMSRTPDDPETWLRGHGWEPTFHRPGELASRYRRPEWSHLEGTGLVDAQRLPAE